MNRIILFLFSSFFIFLGCDVFNPDEEENEALGFNCESDSEGNLVVINYSDSELVLYSGGTPIKCIPNTTEEFVVAISNPNGVAKDLWIFKDSDVFTDYNNPNDSLKFKSWNVILANNYEQEFRKTWFIQPESAEAASGELKMDYFSGSTQYNVDIYLDSQTGARVLSLSPGQSGVTLGLDYGFYPLYYRYWYSDQDSPDGEMEVGWKTPMDYEDMYVTLNQGYPIAYKAVPHWDVDLPEVNGTITITNMGSFPVMIQDGVLGLIEDIMVCEGECAGMSYLNSGHVNDYILPAGNYQLIALWMPEANEEAGTYNFTLGAGTIVNWTIEN